MDGLEIEYWAFWSPEGRSPAQWLEHWSRADATAGSAELAADAIPAGQRRRMSALSKMAVQIAIEASAPGPADYLVFCSQHGELDRTYQLLQDIVAGVELSPTAFSQSVHNTSSGLFSIVTQNRAPASSLASGPSTFAHGWLEAEGFLLENPASRALLVCYDAALPPEYRPYSPQRQCTYAAAMTLRAAPGRGIVLEHDASDAPDDALPLAPTFLAWWSSAVPTLSLTADRQRWRWSRAVS
jgi:hypothetical protein